MDQVPKPIGCHGRCGTRITPRRRVQATQATPPRPRIDVSEPAHPQSEHRHSRHEAKAKAPEAKLVSRPLPPRRPLSGCGRRPSAGTSRCPLIDRRRSLCSISQAHRGIEGKAKPPWISRCAEWAAASCWRRESKTVQKACGKCLTSRLRPSMSSTGPIHKGSPSIWWRSGKAPSGKAPSCAGIPRDLSFRS